ncbi:winged helix-turn-helix transcriptional regulator [Shewanella avicenniae]|uniref:Winged helix-turn-helix transcriptional regulator n=1 Tax=Shewanella avicenniae TaxID=2814294 RepID=A0ABX7QR09_9GAMM|nr:MarR family winged helix-turn-helix transcriptional regulator [Shewanella avicenniae]QSX33849.1 winged helix-turn-helix transcriptional regulator [Shewanella avicenniae]
MEPEESGYQMANILRLLTLTFQTNEKIAGLPMAQAMIVKRVEMCPGIRQFDLAERLSMQPIKVSRVVDQLEEAGLIERRKPGNDHRVRRLYVTPKAQQMIGAIDQTIEEIWQPAWKGIPTADIATFKRVLAQMQDNLVASNTRFPQ